MALTDNVSHVWHLNESSGNIVDSVGSNNGTNNNTCTFVAGKLGNAASLNGSNQRFSLGNIAPATNCSIAARIYLDSVSGERDIFSCFTADTSKMRRMATNGQKLRYHWGGNGSNVAIYDSTNNVISTGSWYSVVCTQEGTNAPIMYINGSSVSVSFWGGTAGTQKPTAIPASLGRSGEYTANYLDGLIDEVIIWDRALSAAEAAEYHNGGNGKEYPFASPFQPYNYIF